jgi:hypothetical protein
MNEQEMKLYFKETTQEERDGHNSYLSFFKETVSHEKVAKAGTIIALKYDKRINASAAKTKTGYRISINTGLIDGVYSQIYDGRQLDRLLKLTKLEAIVGMDELRKLACAIIIYFVFYHELGHVFQGHCDYVLDHSNIPITWTELHANTNTRHPELIEKIHICECNADAFAGLMLPELFYGVSRKLDNDDPANQSKVQMLIAFSLYHLFNYFDSINADRDRYAAPPIRAAIVLAHLFCAFDKENINGVRLLESYFSAEHLYKEQGLVARNYDLKTEWNQWHAKYREKLEASQTFRQYCPTI